MPGLVPGREGLLLHRHHLGPNPIIHNTGRSYIGGLNMVVSQEFVSLLILTDSLLMYDSNIPLDGSSHT